MVGKINKAIELSKNTIPKAILISLPFALITGEIAAIALPPQMAVPEVIRCPSFKSSFNNLANTSPKLTVNRMEKMVKPKPSLLVCSVSLINIPKPNPTTAIFKK